MNPYTLYPIPNIFFFITLGLELRDTKVYEPEMRALLGTASHYCETVVLESRTVPSDTALGSRSGALRWRTHADRSNGLSIGLSTGLSTGLSIGLSTGLSIEAAVIELKTAATAPHAPRV